MKMEKKTFTVNGMACAMCKATVEKALLSLDGVEEAQANVQDKNVHVKYDGTKVTPELMRKAVAEAGFTFIPS